MPLASLLVFYGFAAAYAAVTYFAGPAIPIATVALGFGVLIILYLTVEWVFPPVLAMLIGFQARWWSIPLLMLFGTPVVIIFTVISPVISAGSEAMGVPVPWMAVFAKSRSVVPAIIRERLLWWGLLHVAAVLLGRLSRRIWPLPPSGA